MRLKPVISVLACAAMLAGCASLPVAESNPTHAVPVDAAAAAAAISRYRAAHGLGPVSVDASLTRAAEHQARANARAGRLSHDVGGEFPSRLAAAGFDRSYAAENLSAGTSSIPEVIAQWKASPEHNKNLLTPRASRIGIARVDAPSSRYKRFWALILSSS